MGANYRSVRLLSGQNAGAARGLWCLFVSRRAEAPRRTETEVRKGRTSLVVQHVNVWGSTCFSPEQIYRNVPWKDKRGDACWSKGNEHKMCNEKRLKRRDEAAVQADGEALWSGGRATNGRVAAACSERETRQAVLMYSLAESERHERKNGHIRWWTVRHQCRKRR